MKLQFAKVAGRLTALCFSPWRWLTPRAKLYKVLGYSILFCLGLTLIDLAFVIPRIEGWLAVFSLLAALILSAVMGWKWLEDESLDVPRDWIAPVRRDRRESSH